MNESDAQVSTSPSIAVAGTTMPVSEVVRSIQGSATWFWWIAALSLVNTIAVIMEWQYSMVLGLGVTQVVDVLFMLNEAGEPIVAGGAVRVMHLLLIGLITGVFYLLGRFARALSGRAFLLGMALYAIDALIVLMVGDWIGVGFHGFVLFMLWGGFSMLRALNAQTSVSPPV